MTRKDRISASVLGLILAGAGVAMLIWPSLFDSMLSGDSPEPTRRRTRGMLSLIDFLWGRPAGVILGLLGILLIVSAVRMKDRAASAPNAAN